MLGLGIAIGSLGLWTEEPYAKSNRHTSANRVKAESAELKHEIHQIKRRISSLEKAFDSIMTIDDSGAIEEAHKDLAQGRTVDLSQVKKKHS